MYLNPSDHSEVNNAEFDKMFPRDFPDNLVQALLRPASENEDIYIGLGCNLLLPNANSLRDNVAAALAALERGGVRLLKQSRLYETVSIPRSTQPDYHNLVLKIHATLSPLKLLGFLHGIEAAMGRVRRERNEARVIDLDLLAFGARHSPWQECYLPHPRLAERAFVLCPWADIASDWHHPLTQKTIAELLSELPSGQEIRVIS
ncbi:MAG: 2-amino-4-hydroxy-6-hydroxymethyldihydropteridine diphosphokinase [Alphaproteobacteria bacterium]|nr:2-amino-4-hydroxy-6-hydroxymethyldihydropteridine diphosphokinase [Alphaproteobacteria bacterium]